MDQSKIRNFSIITHIDHGKSTLADRILEVTETVTGREMREQLLDSMDLERERGITIKAQAVRVAWKGHELNLIDTPGHVDFTYEVSRSLQACEGALLVVDAAQGIEAQTLANAYLAIENNLEIVPVVNKIDLQQADPDGAAAEVSDLIGDTPDRVLRISAKTGQGVADVLDAIIERVPAPTGDPHAPARALIFDSSYDQYRGVVAFVRVIDGVFRPRTELRAMALGTRFEAQEIGFMSPGNRPVKELGAGEVGYVITGLKDVSELRVGDTLTAEKNPAAEPLPGYKDVKQMVFAGLFPTESDDYPELRDALEKRELDCVRATDMIGAIFRNAGRTRFGHVRWCAGTAAHSVAAYLGRDGDQSRTLIVDGLMPADKPEVWPDAYFHGHRWPPQPGVQNPPTPYAVELYARGLDNYIWAEGYVIRGPHAGWLTTSRIPYSTHRRADSSRKVFDGPYPN